MGDKEIQPLLHCFYRVRSLYTWQWKSPPPPLLPLWKSISRQSVQCWLAAMDWWSQDPKTGETIDCWIEWEFCLAKKRNRRQRVCQGGPNPPEITQSVNQGGLVSFFYSNLSHRQWTGSSTKIHLLVAFCPKVSMKRGAMRENYDSIRCRQRTRQRDQCAAFLSSSSRLSWSWVVPERDKEVSQDWNNAYSSHLPK